jgi:predicted ATPase
MALKQYQISVGRAAAKRRRGRSWHPREPEPPGMIDRVHFENFQSLQNVTLELGRFTTLVGAGGSGKSSVLQAVHLLTRAADVGVGEVFAAPRAPERLIYRGTPGTIAIAMRETNGDELKLEIHVAKATEVSFEIEGAHRTATAALVTSADPAELAATLEWMGRTARDELAEITADLRRVVPGVQRIVVEPFAIEFDDGYAVPVDQLGDGTMRALGLLTALRAPDRSALLLIDDLERGLHLSAQSQIVTMIHEAMVRDPKLQLVCTTHSPHLVDLLEPSQVRVLALDAERRTHARPLTDHPEFEKWRFGTPPAPTGELWAALGEEWVLDKDRGDGGYAAAR